MRIQGDRACPPVYMLNGTVDVVWRGCAYTDASYQAERICGYEMPAELSNDINTEMNCKMCLNLANKQRQEQKDD